ncbi:myosin-8-like [Pocillopora verrucosa]|uniref:myosin-8-like n=1 Tax=Pocillopora verrucosa TaxID=203993 RepID=UPI0033428F3C
MSCKEEVEKNVSSSNGVEDEVEDEVLISLCESSDTCGDDVSSGKEKNGETISRNKYKLPELLTTIGQRAYSSSANDKRLTKEENMKDAVKPVKQDENMSATGTRQDCRDGTKVSNSYPSADEATIGIDESRTVRFKNNLFVAIEELRIQRTLDVENEEKIRTLMTEKHEEERMKEELIAKNNILIEQQTQMEIDSKKQQEDRLLQYEEDKAKHALAVECAEKELKVLKDEVRTLHLVKYKLEKKIKEQDRLIQLQNSARDSHESQISTLEKRSKKALDRCIQLAELVEKTETKGNVLSTAYDKKPCDKCT